MVQSSESRESTRNGAPVDGSAFVRARRVDPDDTDYEHRHFVNLAAAAFLLAVAIAMVWTIQLMQEHERLQACIDSGRRNCIPIDKHPRPHGVTFLERR